MSKFTNFQTFFLSAIFYSCFPIVNEVFLYLLCLVLLSNNWEVDRKIVLCQLIWVYPVLIICVRNVGFYLGWYTPDVNPVKIQQGSIYFINVYLHSIKEQTG